MSSEKKTPLIAQVLEKQRIRSGFLRVTIGGAELNQIEGDRRGGHLKLLFPRSRTTELEDLFAIREDWRSSCVARTYTLLNHRVEEQQIDIDFALHEGRLGPGGLWARTVQRGEWIMLTPPSEKKLKNFAASNYLMVADRCSYPALVAAIRDIPVAARVNVLLHTHDSSDTDELAEMHDQIQVHQINPVGNSSHGALIDQHLDQLRSIPIDPQSTECYLTGESSVIREIKRYLTHDVGCDLQGMYTSAYWKLQHDQDQHKVAKKREREAADAQIETGIQELTTHNRLSMHGN